MAVNIEISIELPKLPKSFKTSSGNYIPVKQMTDETIYEIGKAITDKLLDMKRAAVNA